MDALLVAYALASRQHSLITRPQALESGLTRRQIDRLLSRRLFVLEQRNVYRVAGSRRTWEQRALGIALGAGGASLISHLAAAHFYGLPSFPPLGLVDVAVPRHNRTKLVGARIHETLHVDLMDPRVRNGIPVTGPARTVLDVCWMADDDLVGLAALDEMRRLHRVPWDDLWTCLVLHARRGRNGVAMYRRVLNRRWGKRVPHGHFERVVQRLLVDAGLREPVAEHPVVCEGRRYRIDLAYPEVKVGIELLGKEVHATDEAFEHDPLRRNRLQNEGWLVLEFTWQRLIEDPNGLVHDVRTALASRSCAV